MAAKSGFLPAVRNDSRMSYRLCPTLSFRAKREICFFLLLFPSSLPSLTQIIPSRVHQFNQRDFLLSPPLLDFLFALDGNAHIGSRFKENQTVDVVSLCKTINQLMLMLVKTTLQIVGHADVEFSRFAGQQVNKVGVFQKQISRFARNDSVFSRR